MFNHADSNSMFVSMKRIGDVTYFFTRTVDIGSNQDNLFMMKFDDYVTPDWRQACAGTVPIVQEVLDNYAAFSAPLGTDGDQSLNWADVYVMLKPVTEYYLEKEIIVNSDNLR